MGYMIAPFDNQNVCLDVWEESKNEGATIGLWDCKGSNNQRFMIDYDGGTLVSGGTLTFKEKSGSSSQKFVFKF